MLRFGRSTLIFLFVWCACYVSGYCQSDLIDGPDECADDTQNFARVKEIQRGPFASLVYGYTANHVVPGIEEISDLATSSDCPKLANDALESLEGPVRSLVDPVRITAIHAIKAIGEEWPRSESIQLVALRLLKYPAFSINDPVQFFAIEAIRVLVEGTPIKDVRDYVRDQIIRNPDFVVKTARNEAEVIEILSILPPPTSG